MASKRKYGQRTRNQRRKEEYAALREASYLNKGSGKHVRKKKVRGLRPERHASGRCWNVGCSRCNSEWYMRMKVLGKPGF